MREVLEVMVESFLGEFLGGGFRFKEVDNVGS